MGKEIVSQVQEEQKVPYRINLRRNTPRHILIKPSKIKYKEKLLKAAREKQQITYKGIPISISCHSLLACRVSAEKSAVSLMGVPLYVICHFSLATFNNFSLSLIFANLITMCLIVFLLGFILYGTPCASWTWVAISFPMLGKFSTIISSNIFSGPFSLLLLGPL